LLDEKSQCIYPDTLANDSFVEMKKASFAWQTPPQESETTARGNKIICAVLS